MLLLFAVVSIVVLYQFLLGQGDNGFSIKTTSEEVVDTFGCPTAQSGDYTVAITGATSGIGQETVLHLLNCGARVFVGGRSKESSLAAIRRLDDLGVPTAKAVPWVAPLSSVRDAVDAGTALVNAKVPLHALVLNAGIMAVPERRATADNLEMMMGVNHVAHAALARAARTALTAPSTCERARLVIVSSSAHGAATAEFLQSPVLERSSYGPLVTYGDTKMANVLFARGAAKHWPEVTTVSLHPGVILTNLSRHTEGFSAYAFRFASTLRDYNVNLVKTVSQGAATTLYTLLAPEVAGLSGEYFENAHLAQPSALLMDAKDPQHVTSLWTTTWAVVDRILAST